MGCSNQRSTADLTCKYVTLLKLLDHLGREIKGGSTVEAVAGEVAGDVGDGTAAGPSTMASTSAPPGQPAHKKRKVSTRARKVIRNTWYAAPSKMNNREPKSRKKPKRHPFVGMMRKSWLRENDPDNLIRLREDYKWWTEFENRIQDGDISEYDAEYLEEIDDDSD